MYSIDFVDWQGQTIDTLPSAKSLDHAIADARANYSGACAKYPNVASFRIVDDHGQGVFWGEPWS